MCWGRGILSLSATTTALRALLTLACTLNIIVVAIVVVVVVVFAVDPNALQVKSASTRPLIFCSLAY